jgi:hypothetical protein
VLPVRPAYTWKESSAAKRAERPRPPGRARRGRRCAGDSLALRASMGGDAGISAPPRPQVLLQREPVRDDDGFRAPGKEEAPAKRAPLHALGTAGSRGHSSRASPRAHGSRPGRARARRRAGSRLRGRPRGSRVKQPPCPVGHRSRRGARRGGTMSRRPARGERRTSTSGPPCKRAREHRTSRSPPATSADRDREERADDACDTGRPAGARAMPRAAT